MSSPAWRPVFLINVPLGLLATAAAARLLPGDGPRRVKSLDLTGAVLAAVASLAVIYPLIQGRALGWPAWTYAAMGASVVLFVLLGFHLRRQQRHGRDPLVEPSIFSHRGYSAGALVLMLYFGGMIGSVLAITLFLQLGEGFSAIHAGLTLAPFAFGTALGAPVGGAAMQRLPGRALIQAGGAISLVGNAALALILASTDHVSTWGLLAPLLVNGVGKRCRRAGFITGSFGGGSRLGAGAGASSDWLIRAIRPFHDSRPALRQDAQERAKEAQQCAAASLLAGRPRASS